MTDLQAHKMPIITDVNDIPSTSADPTHPNASLFCKQYNDLIDSIEGSLPSAPVGCPTTNSGIQWLYLSSNTGSDETGTGEYGQPYATIEKILEVIKENSIVWVRINCDGEFNITPSLVQDICSVVSRNWSAGSGFWTDIQDIGIEFYAESVDPVIFNFEANYSSNNITAVPSLLNSPPHNGFVTFRDSTIVFKGNERHVFRNIKIHFNNCRITDDPVSNTNVLEGLTEFYFCHAIFTGCRFIWSPANFKFPILAYDSTLHIWNNEIFQIGLDPRTASTWFIKAYLCRLLYYTQSITKVRARLCSIFIAFAAGHNLESFGIEEADNLIKQTSANTLANYPFGTNYWNTP